MDIGKWFAEQDIDPIQDREDGMDYWKNYELFTYNDLIECLEELQEQLIKQREKWTIRKDSLNYLSSSDYWTCDIMEEGETPYIITVYAKSEQECLSRAKRICAVNEMEAALKAVKSDYNILGEVTKHTIEKIISIFKDL